MPGPTTRILALLDLLQSQPRLSGAELAECLEVDRRTVRRYITILEDLGIPVTTEQGRYGGYMLVPGFKLPPLMFTDEEAMIIAMGLLAVRESAVLQAGPALESVQAKLERVLPPPLKHRVRAIRENTRLVLRRGNRPEQRESLLALTEAAELRQTVSMHYRSREGEQMHRHIDPYGLVFRWGNWYVSGYCHLRRDLRTFRLDRLADVQLLNQHFERPANFNAAEHLQESMENAWNRYEVEVLLHTDISNVSEYMCHMEALLKQQENGLLLTTHTDSYQWFAWWLMQLPFNFTIIGPEGLKDAMRDHAQRLLASC